MTDTNIATRLDAIATILEKLIAENDCSTCQGTGTVMRSVAGYGPAPDECPGCHGEARSRRQEYDRLLKATRSTA